MTGYPKIVPVEWLGETHYITEENAAEWKVEYESGKTTSIPAEYEGFYELDGHPVYLFWDGLARMTMVGNYFADENGYLQVYTPETKPAIDAHVNEMLAQKKAEASARYGVNFSFKKGYETCDNCAYVIGILENFQKYPEGCVPIIARATKAKTGKNLTFRQKFDKSEDIIMAGSDFLGLYSNESNMVIANGGEDVIAHEMGHGMESVLNSVSKGNLRATFNQLNGGVAYNRAYYYGSNEELYMNVPDCFEREYSATSFAEDFADTFSMALCYDNAALEKEVAQGWCSAALYQKVMYVKQLFNQYAGAEILK